MAYENKRDNVIITYRIVRQFFDKGVSLSQAELVRLSMSYTGVGEVTARNYISLLFQGFVAHFGRKKVFLKIKLVGSNVVMEVSKDGDSGGDKSV